MSDSILKIEEAELEGVRVVLAFSGISGSGKTRTALEVAYGLANFNSKKIGFVDAENRRGRLYSNVLKNERGEVQRFLIANLDAPFSPARYKKAILEFQAAGVEVLVIDSVSHEWEGIGGCHDIAKPSGHGNKPGKWNIAKEEHKSFMNTLLQCDMHIIVCVRAREKVKMQNGANGKVEYIPLGVLPVQEENFMYEMTASVMMWDKGLTQDPMKVPGELETMFGRGKGFITSADGKALRDYLDGAKQLDQRTERNRNMLRTTTEGGMSALQAAWLGLSADERRALSPDGRCPAELKASAEEFDRQRAAAGAADPEIEDLNSELGAKSEAANDGPTDEQEAA